MGSRLGFLLLRNWKGKGACLLFLGRRERLRKKVPGTLVSLQFRCLPADGRIKICIKFFFFFNVLFCNWGIAN